MSLQSRLNAFITAVGADIKSLTGLINQKAPLIAGITSSSATRRYSHVLTVSANSAQSGSLVIKTNVSAPTMVRLAITGYHYKDDQTDLDLRVGCYIYTTSILQKSAVLVGDTQITQVRVAKDAAGKAVFIIDHNGNWEYPKIFVDAILGYSGAANDAYFDGWTAAWETDFSAYTTITPVTLKTTVKSDDIRLSDARTPTAHSHVATTDLTATGTKSSATYLRGDNTWATPPNTTYSAITQAEAESSTSTTARLTTGQRMYQAIAKHARLNTWVPSWTDITDKPTTFAPAEHTHEGAGGAVLHVSATEPVGAQENDLWYQSD